MSAALNEITYRRLMEFSKRRSQLTAARGWALVLVVFGITLIAAMVVDALATESALRWTSSVLIYMSTSVAWFVFCFRETRRSPLARDAERMEVIDPRLRERLVAAVNLGGEGQPVSRTNPVDSNAFREQLQQQVAQLLVPIKASELLPWMLIRRYLFAAVLVAFLYVMAAMVPQLHLWNRVARALFPAANLDRTSNIIITILAPQPNDKVVAASDIIAVVARIDGGVPSHVSLEQRSASKPGQVQTMQASIQRAETNNDLVTTPTRHEFTTNISTDEPWLEYRIIADEASTAWHRLTTRPRPQVIRFNKKLIAPEYTGLGSFVASSPDGHLSALVGTQVELTIETDQPVQSCELSWMGQELNKETNATAQNQNLMFQPVKPAYHEAASTNPLYQVAFTVSQSTSYRVDLISAESGLANAFSPSYTVTAISDKAPLLTWSESTARLHVVSPDQVLTPEIAIEDEFPVVALDQLIRVNDQQEWTKAPLNSSANLIQTVKDASVAASIDGQRLTVDAKWPLDMLKLNLKAGDNLQIKVVAVDSKGHATESETLQWFVSSSTIVIPPTDAELLRQRLANELESFDSRVKQMAQAIEASTKTSSGALTNVDEQLSTLKNLALPLAEMVNIEVPKLLQLAEQTIELDPSPVGSHENERIGQALSFLKNHFASDLASTIASIDTDAKSKPTAQQVNEHTQRIAQSSRTLSEAMRTMATRDVHVRMSTQVEHMETVLRNLTSEQALDDEHYKRRTAVLVRQLKELQQAFLDTLPSVRQETKQRYRQVADAISNQTNLVESSQTNEIANQRNIVSQLTNTMTDLKNPGALDGGLHDAIVQLQRKIEPFLGQPADLIRKAGRNLDQSNLSPDKLPLAQTTSEDALAGLKERRSLVRARVDADRDFASDLGRSAGAFRSLWQNSSLSNSDRKQALEKTAQAIETLQSVHAFAEASSLLGHLLRSERWSLDSTEAKVDHPIQLDNISERLERASQLLRVAKAPNEIADAVDRLRWHEAIQQAAQKLNSRRWDKGPSVSAAAELSQLNEHFDTLRGPLATLADSARKQLDEHNPSLSQLANKAARATRDLQQKSEYLLADAKRESIEPTSVAKELKQKTQQSDAPISELREALVDHADSQDLLDKSQLLNARDADAALDVVDQVRDQLKSSIPDAKQIDAKQLVESLKSASQQQGDAAANLEKLAEFFDKRSHLDGDLDNRQKMSDEFMALAEQLGAESESQERYADAEKLAKLAEAQPSDVLRQLEQQLKQNKPMQSQMSQIAREAAEQALHRLDRASQQQEKMEPQLEASDPNLLAKKRLLLQDLHTTRNNAMQMLGMLASEAKWTAGAAKQDETKSQLDRLETELRKAVTATERVNMDRPFDEMLAAAQEMGDTLKTTEQALKQAAEQLQTAGQSAIHQNDADLANRRREMQDRQRRISQQDIRLMQQAERQAQQQLRQFENEVKQAEQRERALDQHLENMKKATEKNPSNEGLKKQEAEAVRNLAIGRKQLAATDQLKHQGAARVQNAISAREEATQRQSAELSGVNPSAQLSSELSRLAAERGKQILSGLADWINGNHKGALELSSQQIQSSAYEENGIERAVQYSAEDLARAARHEARLENQQTSEQLNAQSSDTTALKEGEVKAAQQAIQNAMASSQSTESATGQANPATSAQAMSAIENAKNAIRSRADDLRTMLSAEQDRAPGPANNQARSAKAQNDDANQLLSAQQMAQLLDELDRQMNLGPKELDADSNPSKNGKGKPTPSTLSSAADQLSSQMSRDRAEQAPKNTDQGMATDSTKANVDPQAPVTVKVLNVDRVGDDWGKLRAQESAGMQESRQENISPVYRQQVEAYFRTLGERSRKK
jgi:hypothetical protein